MGTAITSMPTQIIKMTSRSLKERTISGLIWNAIERFMVQGGQFVIRIMIARMITPAEYGLVGMVAVFLVLSDVIINGGFSQALIQKKPYRFGLLDRFLYQLCLRLVYLWAAVWIRA